MKKLFFFDIDGTLIECENGIYSIRQEDRKAMDMLIQNGHNVFLATGRCKCFIVDGVMDYPFSGYVTCNGAYVEYNGKAVYKKVIPTEAIQLTHDICVERNMAYYFENSENIYILNKSNTKHIEFKNEWGMKDEILVDDFNINDIETYIGMIVVNNEDDVEYIKEKLSPYFDIQRHQFGNSFDLTLKGESKAKGISQLVSSLNLEMKDTIAFGDGRNDVEMLRDVGLGIAMGNGAQEAKNVSDYITDSVNNFGIIKALKHYKYLD